MKRPLLLLLMVGGCVPSMAQISIDNQPSKSSRRFQRPQRSNFDLGGAANAPRGYKLWECAAIELQRG